MSDFKTEAERIKNQATDAYANTSVKTRNIVIGVVIGVILVVAFYFFKG